MLVLWGESSREWLATHAPGLFFTQPFPFQLLFQVVIQQRKSSSEVKQMGPPDLQVSVSKL